MRNVVSVLLVYSYCCTGRMLRLASNFLVENGHLFVAVCFCLSPFLPRSKVHILQLPLPCLANSRYLDFDLFINLMNFLGFTELQRHWRKGGKMVYHLFQKKMDALNLPRKLAAPEKFTKKTVLRQGNRNNFSILL